MWKWTFLDLQNLGYPHFDAVNFMWLYQKNRHGVMALQPHAPNFIYSVEILTKK